MDERPPYDAGHAPEPAPVPVPDTIPRGVFGALERAIDYERSCWEELVVSRSVPWHPNRREDARDRWTEARDILAHLRGLIGAGTDGNHEHA